MRSAMVLLALAGSLWVGGASRGAPPPGDEVQANDNRVPAGRLAGDTLRLDLEIRLATWHPDAPDGPSVTVAAFAESGQAPRIPGPLIRVRAGTVIDAALHNRLPDSTVTLYGFETRPAAGDSGLVLAPGDSRRIRFAAGEPGTYYYHAILGVPDTLCEREQLAGAFVVDAPGAPTDDRIFVINIWGDPDSGRGYRNALTINGRSFPWNERITAAVGDSLHWRWINASVRNHPMHLHGFFFHLDAKGDGKRDTTLAGPARRLEVTDNLLAGQTMAISWSPDRPGNWLFHCHLGFHIITDFSRLDPPLHAEDHFSPDVAHHMGGLVLGISVTAPPGWQVPPAARIDSLRLLVQEGKPRTRSPRLMGYVLQAGDTPPAPDSALVPGPVLVLTRGVPAVITVVNHLPEPTSVHWHGIELESYWDGVAGWSGSGTALAPRIEPGDSFRARLQLPRPGTFIYHTHLDDYEQFTSGLYGAIVVLDPGQRFDPTHDHVYVTGWDDYEHLLVNGDTLPAPLMLAGAGSHRFRFVNIGLAIGVRWILTRDSVLQEWVPAAKDGAERPASNRRRGPAQQRVAVGETADVLVQFPGPGHYQLQMMAEGEVAWRQELVVR